MDLYHIWCDLKDGVSDMDFAARVDAYLGHLRDGGAIEGFRVTRRKLGLGPDGLGEFHITVEVRDLAQLDRAFAEVAARKEPTESLHFGANALVRNVTFALYRDFPDPVREVGAEKF